MIETRQIDNIDIHHVLTFANECYRKGYKNNVSLNAMKWDWCLDNGAWFATFDNDSIVAITGCHTFKDGYRALFRGAQLSPRPVKGLSRYQMQSWGISEHLPLQIKFSNGKPIYITTNVSNDASGRMNRIHKSFKVMAKGGMINYLGDEEIFYTQQSVWKLNVEKYFEIRSRYV